MIKSILKKDNNLKEGDPELEQYDIDNPLYVHPDVTLYDVTDEHVDDFINEIMIELCGKPVSCKAFTDFKSKIQFIIYKNKIDKYE